MSCADTAFDMHLMLYSYPHLVLFVIMMIIQNFRKI